MHKKTQSNAIKITITMNKNSMIYLKNMYPIEDIRIPTKKQ